MPVASGISRPTKTNKSYFPRNQGLWSHLISQLFFLFSPNYCQRLLPIAVKFSDSARWQAEFYRRLASSPAAWSDAAKNVAWIGLKSFEQYGQGWCSAFWQQSGRYKRCIVIQVSKYLMDHLWVFDTGNYLDETGTFATFIGLLEGLLMAYSVEKLQILETLIFC